MTRLTPMDMHNAAITVAVANTPIFLIRRLRENPALKRAYDLHGIQKLFVALTEVMRTAPTTMEQATEAYFYLIALSLDNDASWLRKAKGIRIGPDGLKWFPEIVDYLIASSKPTIIKSMQATAAQSHIIVNPKVIPSASVNMRSTVSVQK